MLYSSDPNKAPSHTGSFVFFVFMILFCAVSIMCDREVEIERQALPEEIELASMLLSEKCDGANCFVYIAHPTHQHEQLYDAVEDRGPFLRMISSSGDNATQVRQGDIFTAVQAFNCEPQDQCGIAPVVAPDSMFEIVIYDAPKGDHKRMICPQSRFVIPQEYLNMPRGF